ncbi:MAG: Glu-tRNA(Gln) amidotransferase subunit GatD [Candidatus Thorarchaeota archaeon]|nr:MAG: Glu-tRNA(Gln) amidotransferase subunit GatD [Candidatus Thorarchaeota archaeon]
MSQIASLSSNSKVRISLSLDNSGYIGLVLEKLSRSNVKVGDTISITQDGEEHVGMLMPRSQVGSDTYHVIIKLDSGYNIGIRLSQETTVLRIKAGKKKPNVQPEPALEKTNLPTVSILSTGGTIASKVDYRTGAVNPALSAQDLYDTVPELKNHANVHAKIIMSVLSENIRPSDWTKIAKSVASEIKTGTNGVIIAHGTDTLGFTSAALAFALQNLPVPVVLVGSQRSSDRPSSDAAMNLIGATNLATKADAAEVFVLMHAETGDSYLHAHRGTRVRKFHTSRRDAFQSVNDYPVFKVVGNDVEEIRVPLLRRDTNRKLVLKPKFEEKVALLKTSPGIEGALVEHLIETGYLGIVIEGTGLGHAPDRLRPSIKKAIDEGIVVAMSSQCLFGRTDLNVYRSGVELLDIGVISCEDMLPETSLVKLMWALANSKNQDATKELLLKTLAGEIDMRSEESEYSSNLGGI